MQITIAQAYQYFIDTKQHLRGDDLPEWFTDQWGDIDNIEQGGFFYCDNQAYIVIKDDKYVLEIENMYWKSEDLTELENILFTNFVLPYQLISLEV